MSDSGTLQDRKAAVLRDLREGKALLEEALKDAKLDELQAAAQWGVQDAVNHMLGGMPYSSMVKRTLGEDRPQFPAWQSAAESWAAKTKELLASIDQGIAMVEPLDDAQLQRVAICGTDEVSVIQFLEWGAPHYLEHGNQIKNEILPLVRGK
jgi:hypothetical protein